MYKERHNTARRFGLNNITQQKTIIK